MFHSNHFFTHISIQLYPLLSPRFYIIAGVTTLKFILFKNAHADFTTLFRYNFSLKNHHQINSKCGSTRVWVFLWNFN